MPTENITYDDLVVGEFPIAADRITLASGQNLLRGAIIGRVTATGQYVLSVAAASDGSQVPLAILAIDANATAGNLATTAYFTGEFNAAKCVFGAGHTASTVNAAFRAASSSLFLRTL